MLRQTADVKFSENSGTLTAHIVGEIDHRGATGVRQIIDDAIKGGSTNMQIILNEALFERQNFK